MGINQLKTFLEVAKVRHFGHAAENLFVTQAAVSARIKQLESDFNCKLLTRDRNNIRLTTAGERLVNYAEIIIMSYQQAKLEVALEEGKSIQLSIGGTPSIWDSFLQRGLTIAIEEFSVFSFVAEVINRDKLRSSLLSRTLDIAISFDPIKEEGLYSEHLTDVELIMVSNKLLNLTTALKERYIYVDWGTRYAFKHDQTHGLEAEPFLRCSTAKIALDYILDKGGSAYLPLVMVKPYLESKTLHRVLGVDVIKRSVYIAYHQRNISVDKIKNIEVMLSGMQQI